MPGLSQALGPGIFTIGETGTELDLTAQTTAMRVNWAEEAEDSMPTLDGSEIGGEPDYVATLAGTLVQDLTAGGMFTYTWSHKGEIVPFTFTPSTEVGQSVTGMCRIKPLNMGGDVKKKNTTEFEWVCIGDPILGADLG